jgi:hypothetical protein
VPLALASLGLGSRRPLLGLFKSSSAAFAIEMGEHEAQKERGAKSRNVNEVSVHGAGRRQTLTAFRRLTCPTNPIQPTQPAAPS